MILYRQQQVLANHVSTLSSIHDMAAIALEQINEFGGVLKGFESLWTDASVSFLFGRARPWLKLMFPSVQNPKCRKQMDGVANCYIVSHDLHPPLSWRQALLWGSVYLRFVSYVNLGGGHVQSIDFIS